MDPLSLLLTVGALVELSTTIFGFLRSVKEGFTERNKLIVEISHLRWMLETLTEFLDIEKHNLEWQQSVLKLNEADGPMQRLQHALEHLKSELQLSRGSARAAHVLCWRNVKERVKESLTEIERNKSFIQIALSIEPTRLLLEMRNSNFHHKYVDLLTWLSPATYESRLGEHVGLRLAGTAQWFLEESSYRAWVSGGTSTLFCSGHPGTGKSVIAATVVDQLRKSVDNHIEPVIYLYCDYRTQESQNLETYLRDIARQLVYAREEAPPFLYDMQRKHEVAGSRPPVDELRRTIKELISDCKAAFFVVDALDECDSKVRRALLSFLRDLQHAHTVRLLATSRPIFKGQELFDEHARIDIRASEHDIRIYARSRLTEFQVHGFDGSTAEMITNAVVQSANDTFLLARLHIDCLIEKHTLRDLKDVLKSLPSGSNDERYAKTYDATMRRIEGQSTADRELAKSVLRWTTVAKRPIRLDELQHALAVRLGDTELDPNGIIDREKLLRVCAGLVVVVRERPSLAVLQHASQAETEPEFVRLIHFSAEEYFRRTSPKLFPHGHANIASRCLTYLSFKEFKGGARKDDAAVKELLQRYPLLEYAARYWGEHAKHVESVWEQDSNELLEALIPFLRQPKSIEQAEQIRQMTSSGIRSGTTATGGDAFHALATFRLSKTCQHFLPLKRYEDRRDSRNQTALHIAAIKGAADLLGKLIQTGNADVDARDADRGWSPLLYAVSNRSKVCVELLLGPGKADVNANSSTGQTALFIAAEIGAPAIAEILLQHPRIDVDHKDQDGNTALTVALQNGQHGIVEILMRSGKLPSSDKIWTQEQMRKLAEGPARTALS